MVVGIFRDCLFFFHFVVVVGGVLCFHRFGFVMLWLSLVVGREKGAERTEEIAAQFGWNVMEVQRMFQSARFVC